MQAALHLEAPAMSVVIPIAPDRSARVLASLARLAPDGPRFDVHTRIGSNPSSSRNDAVANSGGPILAFTDDDCDVAPDWLRRAEAFFAAHPDYDVVGGPQLNGAGEGARARASGQALASWFGSYRQSRRYRRAPTSLAATQYDLSAVNLFVRRTAFERWGPFDERLWPNEETALLRRIEQGGGRIAYDPSLIVYHRRRPSLWGLARQCFGYGRGRTRQARIEGGGWTSIGQLVPVAFLLYVTLLLPSCWWLGAIAALPLAVYAAVAGAVAVAAAVRERDPALALLMPCAFVAIHLGYAAGLVCEGLRGRVGR